MIGDNERTLLQTEIVRNKPVFALGDHLFWSHIEADNEDTALRIFSTLNDSGKPLADADIHNPTGITATKMIIIKLSINKLIYIVT